MIVLGCTCKNIQSNSKLHEIWTALGFCINAANHTLFSDYFELEPSVQPDITMDCTRRQFYEEPRSTRRTTRIRAITFALRRWLDVAVAKKQMGVWVLTVPPRSEIHRMSIHIVSNSTGVHTLIANTLAWRLILQPNRGSSSAGASNAVPCLGSS